MNVMDLIGDTGRDNGKKAVDDIIEHKLAATPQNYELWLHYQHDWTPGLRADIERTLVDGGKLDQHTTETLYEKYFNSQRLNNEVFETGAKLAKELTAALKALRAAGHRTELFTENLDEAAEALEDDKLDSTQLMGLIKSLSAATKEMSRENEELSKRLEASSTEVDDLRKHLEVVRTESLTDALTGVANRKRFDETLRFRIEESQSLGYPISLALCDIDHFKSFNDTWGHQTGDQVIRFVASTLQRLALKDHLVARYGGEEFAVIMPRVSAIQALPVLERMRKAIEAKTLMRKSTNEALGNVTVSFGVADLQLDEKSEGLIMRTDELLYQSKRNGRNQVTHPGIAGQNAA